MSDKDQLHRFLFENVGVRGNVVQLERGWQETVSRHEYPLVARDALGQALCAAVALSATIKFSGSLIIQAQGDGDLHTVVAQATDKGTYRGLARWHGEPDSLGDLGNGRLVMTVERGQGEPYQGIVPLDPKGIAASLEDYFQQSEQLPTRFWLASNGEAATALMLQSMPESDSQDAEGWNRLNILADTVTNEELLSLPVEQLLTRLFHEETVRLFDSQPVAFRCTCSRERIENSLLSLGKAEVDSIIEDQGQVAVDCEFCNRHYEWDAVDAEQLFFDSISPSTKQTH